MNYVHNNNYNNRNVKLSKQAHRNIMGAESTTIREKKTLIL